MSKVKYREYKIKLPALVYAEDYHEFRDHQRIFDSLLENVVVEEIGTSENAPDYYVGLVYKGQRPSELTIDALLAENKIELINWDDE